MIVTPPCHGPGMLALADGRVFRGLGFGAGKTVVGEVVFNTSMFGYEEILTDPSYLGQLVCLTTVEIGNVGVNEDDEESRKWGAEALIVRSLSPVVSNWRASASLPEYMQARGIPGLAEIDTRALTRHVRSSGAIMAALSTEHTDAAKLVDLARNAPSMEGRDLAHVVSTAQPYDWDQPTLWPGRTRVPPSKPIDAHVVAYDFGIKLNILRCLRDEGLRTTVVPADTTADEVLALVPDGVLLSNGPGDPAALPDIVARIRELLERKRDLPVFGICLGHQLLCLALGGHTHKLKFGHHGGNHPVRYEKTTGVEITAQNHGFVVDLGSLGSGAKLTHVHLFDDTVAGLRLSDRPVSSVQYHPEASPGPHDAAHLFSRFADEVRKRRAAAAQP